MEFFIGIGVIIVVLCVVLHFQENNRELSPFEKELKDNNWVYKSGLSGDGTWRQTFFWQSTGCEILEKVYWVYINLEDREVYVTYNSRRGEGNKSFRLYENELENHETLMNALDEKIQWKKEKGIFEACGEYI